jgi:hypothetical protein
MNRMAVLHQILLNHRMLVGTMASYMAGIVIYEDQKETSCSLDVAGEDDKDGDNGGPTQDDLTTALFAVTLAAKFCIYTSTVTLQKWSNIYFI